MTMHRGRRPATATMLATAAVVALAGCGGEGAPMVDDEAPVAVANSLPFEASHLEPRATPTPTEPTPEPSPSDADAADSPDGASPSPARAEGPSSAAAAAFIAADAGAGLEDLEHVVVDLDGDTVPEVVVTGTRDRLGAVRVAWWTGRGYEILASDEAGPGRDITDLRATDVNQDDRVELLVTVEGEGRQSLAVWSVEGRGKVERLEAVGGCADGRHVFGVTTARLQGTGEGPRAIVADCDESPLPVADWSEHRWVWQDAAYRHVDADDVDRPGPPQDAGNGEGNPPDDGGEGRGNGQGRGTGAGSENEESA